MTGGQNIFSFNINDVYFSETEKISGFCAFCLSSQLNSYWKLRKGIKGYLKVLWDFLFCANGNFTWNSLNRLPKMEPDVYKNKLLMLFPFWNTFSFFLWGTKTIDSSVLFEGLYVQLSTSKLFPFQSSHRHRWGILC